MADPEAIGHLHSESAVVGEEAARPSEQKNTPSASGVPTLPPTSSSVDATAGLSILYRTLSIDIDEYTQNRPCMIKDKATVADIAQLHWHTLLTGYVAIQLSTSTRTGLWSYDVTYRQGLYGKNLLIPPPPLHCTRRIAAFFGQSFTPVLLVASVLAFIAWKPLGHPPATANLALAIVLAVVFALHAALNMWQYWSSLRVKHAVKNVLPADCIVLRDGHMASFPASDLVPGDVLMVNAGDTLPADVRFITTTSSSSRAGGDDPAFDRSMLTGASTPLSASAHATNDNYLEARCIGLQGTRCVSGTCMAIVVATGDFTVASRIIKLTGTLPATGMSALERDIAHIIFVVCIILLSVVLLVVILWAAWLRHSHPGWITTSDLFMAVVSLAIALMPMGLPMALATSMTISTNMLRKRSIACKSPNTVEPLASMSIVCADLTGIVSQNKMEVVWCSIRGTSVLETDEAQKELMLGFNTRYNKTAAFIPPSAQYDGVGINRPARYPVPDHGADALDQLRTVAALCNDAQFDVATRHLPLDQQIMHGDVVDKALLHFSETLGAAGSVAELRRAWSTRFTLPFDSKHKCMTRVSSLAHRDGLAIALPTTVASAFQPDDLLLTIKGAPEVLLERMQYCIGPCTGAEYDLTDEWRASIIATRDEWAARGTRVILLARKTLSAASLPRGLSLSAYEDAIQSHAMSGLTLVGMVAMHDPPRPEIDLAINTLRGAGIRMFVVTNEYSATAQKYATHCGLITANCARGLKIDTVADLPHGGPPVLGSDYKTSRTAFGKERFVPHGSRWSIVLSGPEVDALDETQWDALSQYREVVFARTLPAQKLRIVRELRARSYVVGVTGNSVDDLPSLSAADIGIAMGSASAVVREAADVVLMDNSFASILTAVSCSRLTFDNLQKTTAYLLPAGTFAQFWPVFASVVFGIPQILSSFMMIIICMFTDLMAAIALAYETSETNMLTRPPRLPSQDHLVNWKLLLQAGITGTIETVCSFSMAYWYLARSGIPFSSAIWLRFGKLPDSIDPDYYATKVNVARSIYFVSLVVMQLFNLLAMRTRLLSIFQHTRFSMRTRILPLFAPMGFAVVLVIFWLYVPMFQTYLGNMPVPIEYWFLPMAFGMGILLLDESRKYCIRYWPRGGIARIAW